MNWTALILFILGACLTHFLNQEDDTNRIYETIAWYTKLLLNGLWPLFATLILIILTADLIKFLSRLRITVKP